MRKKYNNFEIKDAALSRRFWRKCISMDDDSMINEVHKKVFADYQRDTIQNSTQESSFLACVQNEKLLQALHSLTSKQKKVIELYYFNNLTHQDIAEHMKISRVCVTRLLQRAQERLKTAMLEE